MLKTLVDGSLVSASSYAIYKIPPDTHPYLTVAMALLLGHALLSLISDVRDEWEPNCNIVQQISTSVVEIVVLPLVNIDAYSQSDQNKSLAMIHVAFLIPLMFDLIAKLFTDNGIDDSTETLKELTQLGNILSLFFLAVNEENYYYAGMAVSIFFSKYAVKMITSVQSPRREQAEVLGQVALALTAVGSIGNSI